jgi:polyhydroxybutyrate depolymerase
VIHEASIIAAGKARYYLVDVPANPPAGIVLSLHGSRSTARQQLRLCGMDRLVERGVLVAYPEGGRRRGWGHEWDHDYDLAYLTALVEDLLRRYPQSGGRVVVAGMSGGARMACHFASIRSDLVAAVGAVAGLRAPDRAPEIAPDRVPAGPPVRAIPIIAFHGTADRINPYRGGGRPEWQGSVPDAAEAWAAANATVARREVEPVGATVTRTRYGAAGGPGEVVLWTITGGGHTWPGGRLGLIGSLFLGRTSHEVDATDLIWRFAVAHAAES